MFLPWRKAKRESRPEHEFDVDLLSDVGCCRPVNQDAGSYFKPSDPGGSEKNGLLVIVADGVGGHSGGEVASNLAVEIIGRVYYQDASDPNAALRKACKNANRDIYSAAQKDEQLQGMGTTCVALALRDGHAWCAHVGDSRLYLVRGDAIYLMTQDDSVVMDMVKQGLISLDEARHHSDKNVILRALGTHREVEISLWPEPFPVREGDHFVLCSDGLYDLVEDDEIKNAVIHNAPTAACRDLVVLARNRGGHDNITVAVVSVRPSAKASPEPLPATRAGEALQ